jgi:hypothetical protein
MPDEQELIILRHLEEDQTNFALSRDGVPLPDDSHLVVDHFVPTIKRVAEEGEYKTILLISSATRRSQMTSDQIVASLGTNNGISVMRVVDNRAGALKHGKYKLGLGLFDKHPQVVHAQEVYINETFSEHNPWYRHGDPVHLPNGSYKYPELAEIIDEPGENQAALSIRLYSFLLDLAHLQDESTLAVISSHYMVISRFLSLTSLADKGLESVQSRLPQEPLYIQEWNEGVEMIKPFGYKEFFRVNNYIFKVKARLLKAISPVMEKVRNGFISNEIE